MSEEVKTAAIMVAIAERSSEVAECESSLNELERLLHTAGAYAFSRVIQVKESYDPRTVIGKGKVREISEIVKANEIPLVVFDVELSPMQIRNLEDDIGSGVTVIDRSMLILDIFALHAVSGEGKLQVELAQLKYSAPRLTGKGKDLSRQGGGIGSRGPGESKLETDRRHLHEKITMLEARLRELENNRAVMRAQRDRSGLMKIALCGYTNAGKSTLLNALTGAGVLSEDKLFATLDPTTRKASLPSGESVLFTDTVGFIRKLPHHLVKAFKSTLDEVVFADVLYIVVDASDPEAEDQLKTTEEVISELSASSKPVVYVYNKCDRLENVKIEKSDRKCVAVSAKTGEGLDELVAVTEELLREGKRSARLLIPYTDQHATSSLHSEYRIEALEYRDDGVYIKTMLDQKGVGKYGKFIID